MLIVLAHPDLLGEHAEDLAALDFGTVGGGDRDLGRLRDALLDRAHDRVDSAERLRSDLADVGFGPLLRRLDASGSSSAWYLRPEASTIDAAHVLRQALTLHHRARALHRELLSAELALASEQSEANMARLRDILEQLGALTGAEAAIEGFGASSGRAAAAF